MEKMPEILNNNKEIIIPNSSSISDLARSANAMRESYRWDEKANKFVNSAEGEVDYERLEWEQEKKKIEEDRLAEMRRKVERGQALAEADRLSKEEDARRLQERQALAEAQRLESLAIRNAQAEKQRLEDEARERASQYSESQLQATQQQMSNANAKKAMDLSALLEADDYQAIDEQDAILLQTEKELISMSNLP